MDLRVKTKAGNTRRITEITENTEELASPMRMLHAMITGGVTDNNCIAHATLAEGQHPAIGRAVLVVLQLAMALAPAAVSTPADLRRYRRMLVTVGERVVAAVRHGESRAADRRRSPRTIPSAAALSRLSGAAGSSA